MYTRKYLINLDVNCHYRKKQFGQGDLGIGSRDDNCTMMIYLYSFIRTIQLRISIIH